MKLRIFSVVLFAVLFLSAITFADDKGDCTAKTAKASSCCMKGAKASLTSATKSTDGADVTAHVMPVNNVTTDGKSAVDCQHDSKECDMKTAKMSGDCTAADKAHCDMAKSGKMTMKAGTKMNCCKPKNAEAKNSTGKSKDTKATPIVKGTN